MRFLTPQEREVLGIESKTVRWHRKEAYKWFHAKTAKGVMGKLKPSYPTIGKMYMYVYDAKYKDTLPMWDEFPLMMPINITATHILGINFHYIPPIARAKYLARLLILEGKHNIDDNTRLRLRYELIKSLPYTKDMIKKYINWRIKSQFYEVHPEEWKYIIFLPLAKWHGDERPHWHRR